MGREFGYGDVSPPVPQGPVAFNRRYVHLPLCHDSLDLREEGTKGDKWEGRDDEGGGEAAE